MSEGTNTSAARPLSPLDEVVREGARQLLQRALEVEVADVLARFDGLRDEDNHHRVVRNGHLPERTVLTGAGPLDVRQPRLRDRAGKDAPDYVQFSSSILPRYLRRSPSVDALIPWLYLKGISAADMGEALQALVGTNVANLSAGVVLKLKEAWERELKEWRRRDLSDPEYVYWWADGLYFNIPIRKVVAKERLGPRVLKRYHEPRTAYQRLLESGALTNDQRHIVDARLRALNPAELQRRIDQLLRQLWRLGQQEPKLAAEVG